MIYECLIYLFAWRKCHYGPGGYCYGQTSSLWWPINGVLIYDISRDYDIILLYIPTRYGYWAGRGECSRLKTSANGFIRTIDITTYAAGKPKNRFFTRVVVFDLERGTDEKNAGLKAETEVYDPKSDRVGIFLRFGRIYI